MSTTFPFSQGPNSAIPQVIDYDLIIMEDFPGVVFWPTSPGGVYAEIRDVNGCLWQVLNAMWNPNVAQWQQNSPANPAQPAYALVQCEASGTITWNIAQPSGAINTPLTWVPVWQINNDGTMVVEPLELTAQGQIAFKIVPLWDGGSAAKMIARQIKVTDTSSEADSALDQLVVNNVVQWEIRKDGTLVIGKVPASAIVGGVITAVNGTADIVDVTTSGTVATVDLHHGDYVDIENAQSIGPGVKTFLDNVFFGSNTGTEGSMNGTAVSWAIGYGSAWEAAPFTWLAHAAVATIIEVKGDGTFNFYSDSGLTIGNTYNPTLRLSIAADGTIPTGGTIPPATLAGEFEGNGGIVVSFDSGTDKVDVDGTALVETITTTDNSIVAVRTGQSVDLSVNPASTILPQGGNLTIALDPSGTGPGTAVTIPNPYGSQLDYIAVPVLAGTNHPAAVSLYVHQDSGSQFHVFASSDATTGNVEVNWITVPV